MHPVSLIPTLLSYQELSPLLIRIVLAVVLLHWSYKRLRGQGETRSKLVGILDALLGILLLVGLWTQPVALVFAIDIVIRSIKKISEKAFLTDGLNYYLILLVLCVSLLVSGAGWLAFDLSL